MSNVVAVNFKPKVQSQPERIRRLADIFAHGRRFGEDVLWLKENAELLGVLESADIELPANALSAYDVFYDRVAERMAYFPQYYRFFLAMTLDLEDLTGCGTTGETLVAFAAQSGLADAEMSDLQRAEARRLMQRRGVDPVQDTGLDDRLRAFASREATFALPNKKAAYELTHIVFYLSGYGRWDPNLPRAVERSLHAAGTLAALEMNADLLSEICVALRFAGWSVPAAWETWLEGYVAQTRVLPRDHTAQPDGYHQFLVTSWHAHIRGGALFASELPESGPVDFVVPQPDVHALREVSQALMLDPARSPDWPLMQRRLAAAISDTAYEHLMYVAETAPDFEAFFGHFARPVQLDTVPMGLTSGFGV
ncbi:DUF6902 family protein [Pseudaestuariivita sp.]|uniref:DUF6902 family protein n=1 Tax=Pseudaestuariivita sp. TaxID=2211669 RepID=UPI004058EE0E